MPSTVIASMQYFEDEERLRIVFLSGAVYDYMHVPAAVFLAMKASGSKGIYLNQHIKGRYAFSKVREGSD